MSYHTPSLKKLVKPPKGYDSKIIAIPSENSHIWISNGKFAIRLLKQLVPVELVGFMPTADEPTGYTWDSNTGRNPSSVDMGAVIPEGASPAELTDWIRHNEYEKIKRLRVVAMSNGDPAFFNDDMLTTLLKVFGVPVDLFSAGPKSALVGKVDGDIVFLLMPTGVDENSTTAIEGFAITAAGRHLKGSEVA